MAVAVQEISYSVEATSTAELAVEAAPAVLAKRASQTVAFRYTPSALGPFSARVPIEVNGLYTVHVSLAANVVPRGVELVDRSQRTVALGPIKVGKSRRCEVQLINRAPIPVTVDFAPAAHLAAVCGVHIETPTLQLAARARRAVVLVFKPKERLASFTHAVRAKVAGAESTMFAVTGAALGLQVELGTNTLPFGTVVLGSRTTKHIQLVNSGAPPPLSSLGRFLTHKSC